MNLEICLIIDLYFCFWNQFNILRWKLWNFYIFLPMKHGEHKKNSSPKKKYSEPKLKPTLHLSLSIKLEIDYEPNTIFPNASKQHSNKCTQEIPCTCTRELANSDPCYDHQHVGDDHLDLYDYPELTSTSKIEIEPVNTVRH